MGSIPFSTLFSAEIVNAPRYRKVEMPTVDLYDGTTDPKEHLGVYPIELLSILSRYPEGGSTVLVQLFGAGKHLVFSGPG